jgi:hypothetical protein
MSSQHPLAELNQRDYGLTIARIAWLVITCLTLGLLIAGIPGCFMQLASTVDKRSLLELGLPADFYAGGIIVLSLIFVLAHLVMAVVIIWRRPGEWMALFVCFALVTNGAMIPLSLMYAPGFGSPLAQFLVHGVTFIALVSGIILLYLFPDGRFVPPWTRLFALIWAILTFLAFWPSSALSLPTWPIWLQLLTLLVWPGIGLFAQLYRYRHVSSLIQRQQTKWAMLGLTAAALGPLVYFLPFVILPSLNGPLIPNILYQRVGASLFTFSFLLRLTGLTALTFVLLLFPLTLAIAVLRYHLWEIDILINRALVYGLLTGALGLVYFVSVALLQSLLRVFTEGSQLAIIISTLAIAALFNPLRHRIQTLIDRRFYRHKYDAAQVLAAFSATIRDEVDLNRLTEQLRLVVEETMQPEHVSLWLRSPGDNGDKSDTVRR